MQVGWKLEWFETLAEALEWQVKRIGEGTAKEFNSS